MFTTTSCLQVPHPCHRCSLSNPVDLSSEVLTPSSLTCQPRCVLNAKTIKASLFFSYGKEISPRPKKITVCLACASNVSVHGPGSLSSKWCQNNFDHYPWKKTQQNNQTKDNISPLRTMARAWQLSQSSWALAYPEIAGILQYFRGVKLPSSF